MHDFGRVHDGGRRAAVAAILSAQVRARLFSGPARFRAGRLLSRLANLNETLGRRDAAAGVKRAGIISPLRR
jgi:hypothetical protein